MFLSACLLCSRTAEGIITPVVLGNYHTGSVLWPQNNVQGRVPKQLRPRRPRRSRDINFSGPYKNKTLCSNLLRKCIQPLSFSGVKCSQKRLCLNGYNSPSLQVNTSQSIRMKRMYHFHQLILQIKTISLRNFKHLQDGWVGETQCFLQYIWQKFFWAHFEKVKLLAHDAERKKEATPCQKCTAGPVSMDLSSIWRKSAWPRVRKLSPKARKSMHFGGLSNW